MTLLGYLHNKLTGKKSSRLNRAYCYWVALSGQRSQHTPCRLIFFRTQTSFSTYACVMSMNIYGG